MAREFKQRTQHVKDDFDYFAKDFKKKAESMGSGFKNKYDEQNKKFEQWQQE